MAAYQNGDVSVRNAVSFAMPICSQDSSVQKKTEEFFIAKIYIKSINEWIETTKEEHDNYYKDINAYRRTQQNHGNCICPRQKYYYCNMDCYSCKYHVANDTGSLDCTYEDENGNETSLVNMIPDDGKDAESIVTDKLFLKLLFERLDELMPEAKLIGELRLKGQNDNVISQQMNMPRTTMLSRLNKVKKILEKEFPEIFEILSSK